MFNLEQCHSSSESSSSISPNETYETTEKSNKSDFLLSGGEQKRRWKDAIFMPAVDLCELGSDFW